MVLSDISDKVGSFPRQTKITARQRYFLWDVSVTLNQCEAKREEFLVQQQIQGRQNLLRYRKIHPTSEFMTGPIFDISTVFIFVKVCAETKLHIATLPLTLLWHTDCFCWLTARGSMAASNVVRKV